jgi:hypothetical protein
MKNIKQVKLCNRIFMRALSGGKIWEVRCCSGQVGAIVKAKLPLHWKFSGMLTMKGKGLIYSPLVIYGLNNRRISIRFQRGQSDFSS